MNVGEKYIIEIAEITTGAESGNKRARIKGFDGLYFDRNGISKLTKYDPEVEYDKGYEARKTEESKSAEMLVTGDREILEREYQRGYDDGKRELEKIAEKGGYYQLGLETAWETAFKVFFQDDVSREVIFGTKYLSNVKKMGAAKVIEIFQEREEEEKRNSCGDCRHLDTGTAEYCNGYGCKDYDKYEKRQTDEIEVGDEVIYHGGGPNDGVKGIVIGACNDWREVKFTSSWNCVGVDKNTLEKTGRHFDQIAKVLEQMKD